MIDNRKITDNIIKYLKRHQSREESEIFLEANKDVLQKLPVCFLVEIQAEIANVK